VEDDEELGRLSMAAEESAAIKERYLERNRTREEIRRSGAIGNLNDGIEITTHGISTRIIAWPGNGFQTQSVHVLTLPPGQASGSYRYDMAEESLLCIKGNGEVFLRGRWVEIEAGDVAFFPERVERGIRNPQENQADFVLVNQIAPPQFDLYEPAGYYVREHGVMDFEAIEAAKKKAKRSGNLSPEAEAHLNESHPEVRPWNLSAEEISREGALFNVYKGAMFGELGTAMALVLWPGYGARSAGLHTGYSDPGQRAAIHTHPDSDECLFNVVGTAQWYCGDRWLDGQYWDCLLAPCGVHHTVGGSRDPSAGRGVGTGFASPPQLDLYLKTPYYKDGRFVEPPWGTLEA
jgi:mannose-6-phosphate isomerase-like protein (cupin superfamily)